VIYNIIEFYRMKMCGGHLLPHPWCSFGHVKLNVSLLHTLDLPARGGIGGLPSFKKENIHGVLGSFMRRHKRDHTPTNIRAEESEERI
jgi:hypothetical protein